MSILEYTYAISFLLFCLAALVICYLEKHRYKRIIVIYIFAITTFVITYVSIIIWGTFEVAGIAYNDFKSIYIDLSYSECLSTVSSLFTFIGTALFALFGFILKEYWNNIKMNNASSKNS